MKAAACILLASFVAFVTETIKLPVTYSESRKVEKSTCPKMRCAQQRSCANHDQQNSRPRDCNNSTRCIDCPVCAVFAGHQASSLSTQPAFNSREYSILQVHALADYCSLQWKPPDVA